MEKVLGEAILGAFQQRIGDRKLICGLCGGTRWKTSDVVNLPVQEGIGEGMVIGGKVMPLVSLICEICGNMLWMNLIVLLGKERVEEIKKQIVGGKILKEALGEEGG